MGWSLIKTTQHFFPNESLFEMYQYLQKTCSKLTSKANIYVNLFKVYFGFFVLLTVDGSPSKDLPMRDTDPYPVPTQVTSTGNRMRRNVAIHTGEYHVVL